MADSSHELAPVVLALTTAFYHPDTDIRKSIQDTVETWLESLRPRVSREQARSVLETEKGTPLEPFVLTPPDLDCATTLIRAAFSERVAATRVRVVSRDTLGNQGGLVITNNLKSHYWERLGRGGKPSAHGAYPSFFPGLLSEKELCGTIKVLFTTACIEFSDAGLDIRLKWPGQMPSAPGYLARQLQLNSRIIGSDLSFSELGLRVECDTEGICVQTGNSEAQIRLMAHIENKGVMMICGGTEYDWPRTYIPLRLPEGQSTTVKVVRTATRDLCPWFAFDCPSSIPLKETQLLAISRWIGPHRDWVDPLLSKLL